jgi:hypothetical protein
MNGAMIRSSNSGQAPPKPLRFGLWSLFRLQLVLAPLFLVPIYLNIPRQHPYVAGLALLLAPAAYVAALLILFPLERERRLGVLPSVWRGARWGALFGSLSMVPAMVMQWLPQFGHWLREAEMLANVLFYASVRQQFGDHLGEVFMRLFGLVFGGPLLMGFILLHYALIGAAVGGVTGLVINRRVASTIEASTQY